MVVSAYFHLRYIAACYYDEVLSVRSKLTTLGRSSATMDQAIVGADGSLRAIARVIVVRSQGDGTLPWSGAQRDRLAPLVVAASEAARP